MEDQIMPTYPKIAAFFKTYKKQNNITSNNIDDVIKLVEDNPLTQDHNQTKPFFYGYEVDNKNKPLIKYNYIDVFFPRKV